MNAIERKTYRQIKELWNEANLYASKMLTTFSKDELGGDRAAFGKRWCQAVDWNRIEEHGSVSIPEVLDVAFFRVFRGNDAIDPYPYPYDAPVRKNKDKMDMTGTWGWSGCCWPLICFECWEEHTMHFYGHRGPVDCPACANTRREPIPFEEVW